MAIGAVKLQLVTLQRCPVTAEAAGSSPVVPAIFSNHLQVLVPFVAHLGQASPTFSSRRRVLRLAILSRFAGLPRRPARMYPPTGEPRVFQSAKSTSRSSPLTPILRAQATSLGRTRAQHGHDPDGGALKRHILERREKGLHFVALCGFGLALLHGGFGNECAMRGIVGIASR